MHESRWQDFYRNDFRDERGVYGDGHGGVRHAPRLPGAWWNEKSKDLQKLQLDNKHLNEDLDNLERQVNTITVSNRQSLTKVENEWTRAVKDRTQLEKEKADLEKDKREAIATVNATQKNATDYRTELEKRRAEIDQARQDRDAHFRNVVELTDRLNQEANDKKLLQDRLKDLVRDFSKAKEALDYFHINWKGPYRGEAAGCRWAGAGRAGQRAHRNFDRVRLRTATGPPLAHHPRGRRREHLCRQRRSRRDHAG